MMNSLYSGITGMQAQQRALDVTGNNLANSRTTAFKSQQVQFQDMMYQTTAMSQAPSMYQGGSNAQMVGAGVQVGSIYTDHSQGMLEVTGSRNHVAIDGSGYFLVASTPIPGSNDDCISVNPDGTFSAVNGNTSTAYTRDGSFYINSDGYMVTSNGYYVMGYPLTDGTHSSIDYSNGGAGTYINPDSGTLKAESNLVPMRIPTYVTKYKTPSNISGDEPADMKSTGSGSKSYINGAPTIHTGGSDILCKADIDIQVKWNEDDEVWEYVVTDANGDKTTVEVDPEGTGTFYIDAKGNVRTAQPGGVEGEDYTAITVTAPDIEATDGDGEEIDWSDYSWSFTLEGSEAELSVVTYNIDADGKLVAILEDGSSTALGQFAIADFSNTAGLEQMGGNMYMNTTNSGTPILAAGIGWPGAGDSSYGSFVQGMLEMSNVDMTVEFTDMILNTRAYQASAKVITTADQMLDELMAIKR